MYVEGMRDAGVHVKQAGGMREEGPLQGKLFVFTGSLEDYSRSEAKKLVESLGGRAASSVGSNTDYVVAGEGPGSKLDEAKRQNTKVINEREFKELVSRDG